MKKLPDKIRLGKYILIQSQGDFLDTRSDELALNTDELALRKSTVAQIVTVSIKYGIWECLSSHLEGYFF